MAYSEADKLKDPILRVFEPIKDSDSSVVMQDLAIAKVGETYSALRGEILNYDRRNESTDRRFISDNAKRLNGDLQKIGFDSAIAGQVSQRFDDFASSAIVGNKIFRSK